MKQLHYIPLLLLPLLAACVREIPGDSSPAIPDGIEATLTLHVPGATGTRALTESDESAIETIDVLVFREDGADKKYSYRASTTAIGGTVTDKTFRVTVKKDAQPQQLLVLANARAVVDNLTLSTTLTRDQVMALLEQTTTGKWTGTRLPMWGQTAFLVISDAASAEAEIDLARALARVDVTVASTAKADFTLEKVWLYKPSTKGRLVPLDANWHATNKRATAPSAPASGWTPGAAPLEYAVANNETLVREIYTYEAPAAASNTSSSATCLLLQGKWKGGATSYYRVDFHDGTGFLPLLRNHRYDVQVTAVAGNGYPTPAEALAAGFTALTTTTHAWSGNDARVFVWDDRDWLAVTAAAYTLDPVSQTLPVEIATSYAEGWVATEQLDWLSINGSSTGTGDGASRQLTLAITANSGPGNRAGTVTITAGRLVQTITITQLVVPPSSLEVSDVELIFPGTVTTPQTLRVEWEPAATDCTVAVVAASGYSYGVAFNTYPLPGTPPPPGTLVDTDSDPTNGGLAILTLRPDNQTLSGFTERRSILRITNGALVKEVVLRQFNNLITVGGRMSDGYYQPGTTYTLYLQSNVRWTVNIASGTSIASHSAVTGDPSTTNVPVTFTTANVADEATGVLRFSSEEAGLATPVDVPVRIRGMLPNCYVVQPGTTNFTFPVRKAYDAWETDIDLASDYPAAFTGTQTAELLWQDELGLIPSTPTLTGSGRDATIRVSTAAGKKGNAVIALKVDGIIRWSWHIWVTDEDPNAPAYQKQAPYFGLTLMDRNLGATSSTIPLDYTDVRSFGLFYQWGRKDPFPGLQTANVQHVAKAIYLFDGIPTSATSVPTTVTRNLVNAIENPLVFYQGQPRTENTNWEKDWFTDDVSGTMTNHRNDFWPNGQTKGVYDPCPEGWRVSPEFFTEHVLYKQADWTEYRGITLQDLGYVPAAGYKYETGLYPGYAQFFVATAATTSTAAYVIGISKTALSQGVSRRAYGYSIRCSKVQ